MNDFAVAIFFLARAVNPLIQFFNYKHNTLAKTKL